MRRRCEALLQEGEDILLEAESTTCKLGRFRELGSGFACLTDKRILWIRRGSSLLWIPERVVIERSKMSSVLFGKEWQRAWLTITADRETYTLRLGRGPYPALTANIETTNEWFRTLSRDQAYDIGEATGGETMGMAGVGVIVLAALALPFWLVGFTLTSMPAGVFAVMAVLTLLMLGLGLSFVLRARRIPHK